jgi:hypothetical protein
VSPCAALLALVLTVAPGALPQTPTPAVHSSAPPPSAAPLPDPYAIYDRATAFVRSQTYPRYVDFVTTARARVKAGRWLVEQFQSTLYAPNDIVGTASRPISSTNREENPYGFSLFPGWGRPRGNIDEPFGVPYISPAYEFGLVHEQLVRDVAPPAGPAEKSLGTVLTVGRDYEVTLSGIEQFHGHAVYSLELRPLGSPRIFRLRELLVDTKSSVIWGLTTAGIFETGQATDQTWYVVFQMIDGRWYISYERTYDHFHGGGTLGVGGFRYEYVSYSFTDFKYPQNVYDSVFTQGVVESQAVQM